MVALRDPEQPLILVGASGAIMALGGAVLAALLVSRPLRTSAIGRRGLILLVVLLALQVLFDLVTPQVSGTAHAAGIAAGLAVLLPRKDPVFSDMPERAG